MLPGKPDSLFKVGPRHLELTALREQRGVAVCIMRKVNDANGYANPDSLVRTLFKRGSRSFRSNPGTPQRDVRTWMNAFHDSSLIFAS